MKNQNWKEFSLRIYYIMWGVLVLSMTLWMFNIVILENNYAASFAALAIIASAVVGPWIGLKLAKWVAAGLYSKKGD
jgi:hypothetical protein